MKVSWKLIVGVGVLKWFVVMVLLLLVFILGCGNDKYVKEIDEVVKI